MIAAPPPVYPWPIGVGPRYHPTANRRAETLRCGPLGTRYRVHLELFANRRVVIVPAGIGGCDAPLRTTEPTGVVELTGRRTLGDLFAIWGRRLEQNGFLTFRGRVSAFVNGRGVTGDPGRIALRPRDEIVLEVGGYVAPHRDYLFPRGDR